MPCTRHLAKTTSIFTAGRETIVKQFADLTEREILALAISNEDEDSRIYHGFAEGLAEQYPASAAMLAGMAEEDIRHRGMLFDLYRAKFGEYLPLIRRQDVKGFIKRKPLWLTRPLGIAEVRKYAASMEQDAARFYRKAADTTRDASVRELLIKLSEGFRGIVVVPFSGIRRYQPIKGVMSDAKIPIKVGDAIELRHAWQPRARAAARVW